MLKEIDSEMFSWKRSPGLRSHINSKFSETLFMQNFSCQEHLSGTLIDIEAYQKKEKDTLIVLNGSCIPASVSLLMTKSSIINRASKID